MVLDLAKDLDDQKIDLIGEELKLGAAEVSRIKRTNSLNQTHPEGGGALSTLVASDYHYIKYGLNHMNIFLCTFEFFFWSNHI